MLLLVLDVWMLASGATHDRAAAWGAIFVFALFAAAFALPLFRKQPKNLYRVPAPRVPGKFPHVILFYGVKTVVPQRKKKLIAKIEADRSSVGLKQAGLEAISGFIGKNYFCYVGRKLGIVGLDFAGHIHYSVDSLAEISADVQARLKKSGTMGTPSFHMWKS
ncbi:MAG TPA: hypothetical protein VFP71_14270 [Candidatus Angelobacter sp.]|nr:hypothetical protein [Candidatus Angelobacter sp.]